MAVEHVNLKLTELNNFPKKWPIGQVARGPLFCSYHILPSSVNYIKLNRRTAKWNLFVSYTDHKRKRTLEINFQVALRIFQRLNTGSGVV